MPPIEQRFGNKYLLDGEYIRATADCGSCNFFIGDDGLRYCGRNIHFLFLLGEPEGNCQFDRFSTPDEQSIGYIEKVIHEQVNGGD